MTTFNEAYAALDDYRAALSNEMPADADTLSAYAAALPSADETRSRGVFSAFASPLQNVHATGVGIRIRGGKPVPDDFVIKVYVYDKRDLGIRTPALTGKAYKGVGIDVEALPIQMALEAKAKRAKSPKSPKTIKQTAPADHQARRRPAIGGIQISPAGASFVGTLGSLVRSGNRLLLLSNNHVLADTNRLPIGTPIVQPSGPGTQDVIARLSAFEPIRFPTPTVPSPRNRLDAAVAAVSDTSLVATGSIFGIANYVPRLAAARPGQAVVKSGRTTGVTRGLVTAIRVNGVQVNYGTRQNPLIATFDGIVQISGSAGVGFSAPGDSGSVILDANTGEAVALLFAGDGVTTSACDLTAACTRFGVVPA